MRLVVVPRPPDAVLHPPRRWVWRAASRAGLALLAAPFLALAALSLLAVAPLALLAAVPALACACLLAWRDARAERQALSRDEGVRRIVPPPAVRS
jgi:uncharacterized membrane protein